MRSPVAGAAKAEPMIPGEFLFDKELDLGTVKGQHCTSPVLDLARRDQPGPIDGASGCHGCGRALAISVCNWARETTPSFGKIRYK